MVVGMIMELLGELRIEATQEDEYNIELSDGTRIFDSGQGLWDIVTPQHLRIGSVYDLDTMEEVLRTHSYC